MPFALTFVGLILIITGFQNTYKAFGTQVQGDFSGKGSFLYWLLAIIIVGSIGYIKELQSASRIFMVLIIVAIMVQKNSGVAQGINFFSGLTSGLASGSNSNTDSVGAPLAGSSGGGGGGGSSGGGLDLGNVGQDMQLAETAAAIFA